MSEVDVSARLIAAANACAQASAGKRAPLVSITLEFLSDADAAEIASSVTRQTRTLIFVSTEAKAGDGAHVAIATSVHKILD